MKKGLIRTIGAMMIFGLILGLVRVDVARAEEAQKIQVPSQMPVGHPITQAMEVFCQTVTQKSQGRLVLQSFPASQLLTDREIPKAVSTGRIKMAQTYLAWWVGLIPDLVPYGGKSCDDLEHFFRLARGPLLEYQKKLLAEKAECRIIAPLLYGIRAGYILTKPVKKPGDMKGMKIRVSSKTLAAETMALGGVPTVMSSADVYMALQRGTIQGAHSGLGAFFARKWYEVAKYIFITRFNTTDFHIVVHKPWFDGLSEPQRRIILEAGKEATAVCTKMVLVMEDKVMAGLKAQGVEIHEVNPTEFKRDFAPLIEPALRAAAVKEFGLPLVDRVDAWVEETRAK